MERSSPQGIDCSTKPRGWQPLENVWHCPCGSVAKVINSEQPRELGPQPTSTRSAHCFAAFRREAL